MGGNDDETAWEGAASRVIHESEYLPVKRMYLGEKENPRADICRFGFFYP